MLIQINANHFLTIKYEITHHVLVGGIKPILKLFLLQTFEIVPKWDSCDDVLLCTIPGVVLI